MDMVSGESRLAVRRHRRLVVVLAVSIALALSALGIESASASTRSRLALSLNSDRSSAARLDGSTVNGKIYVFVRNSKNLDKVAFYIDSPQWRKRPPARTDKKAPFDLAGTATDGTARPYNTAKLADGSHSITVVMTWANGTTSTRRVRFKVHNGSAKPTPTPTQTPTNTASPTSQSTTTAPTTTAPTTTAPATTGPTTATAPATTTAPTPPRTTAPPTTSAPTATATPPRNCANGDTIKEGVAASYFEADGGEYLIHNNNWNDDAGGNTVITACDYDNWYLVSDTPNHSDMSVQTYPNVHRDYNDVSLTKIKSARFGATGPRCSGCVYNIAFDIWLGSGFSHELMIWTDNWGQRPLGNVVDTVTIGGHQYQVWRSGSGDGGVFTYLSTTPQLSGDMPLSEFFKDAQNRGWKATTTWQVDYGVEIVDTNGNPERFNFTDFAITD
jgi:Glycosyl hydrolase family 12